MGKLGLLVGRKPPSDTSVTTPDVAHKDEADPKQSNSARSKQTSNGSNIWVRRQYIDQLKRCIHEATRKFQSSFDSSDTEARRDDYIWWPRKDIIKLQQDLRLARDHSQRLRLRANGQSINSKDMKKTRSASVKVPITSPGCPPRCNKLVTQPPRQHKRGSSGHARLFKEQLAKALGLGKLLKKYPYSSSGSEPIGEFTECEIEKLQELFEYVNQKAKETWETWRVRRDSGKPEILRKLGNGSYGQVHLCRKTPTSKIIVVKRAIFDERRILDMHGHTARIDHCMHRLEIFIRELKVFETLKRDALPVDLNNIVAYHGYGEWANDDGVDHRHLYLEWCDGDLVGQLSGGLHLNQGEDLKMLVDVMKGLSTIHRHHMIHQDIKPDNILFNLYRNVQGHTRRVWKICDFGLASFQGDNEEYQFTGGSLPYMSPERFNKDRKPDEKIDVWGAYVTWLETRFKINDGHQYEKCPEEGLYEWKKRYQDVITAAQNDSLYPMKETDSMGRFFAAVAGDDPAKRPSAGAILVRIAREPGLMAMAEGHTE